MSSSLRVGGEKSAPVRRGAGAGMACRQRKSARPTENPQCGFADFGRFSLWRPIVVERTRGSNRVQAQPAGRKRVQAQPAGRKWGQAQPACRKSARPTENPQRGFADFGRFNLWRPIVVERTRGSNRVQALPAVRNPCRGRSSSFPPAKNLEALIYGRQIRVLFGGSQWVQAQPVGSRWVRALPGQKSRLSNVAFYRNVRVWATVCSWPGSTRIMPGLWVSCWSQST